MTTPKRQICGHALENLDRGIDGAATAEEGIAALAEALSAANERIGRLETLVGSLEQRLVRELSKALEANARKRQQK